VFAPTGDYIKSLIEHLRQLAQHLRTDSPFHTLVYLQEICKKVSRTALNTTSGGPAQSRILPNVFVKLDDQSETCFSFGMARKGA
jgi:hypothetical protein